MGFRRSCFGLSFKPRLKEPDSETSGLSSGALYGSFRCFGALGRAFLNQVPTLGFRVSGSG